MTKESKFPVNSHKNTSLLQLRIRPNAAQSKVISFSDGVLQIKVAAPPTKGKANKELIALLSKVLGVGKGALEITKGHTSRNKVITVDGLTQEEVFQRLLTKPSSSSSDNATSRIDHQ